MSLPVSSPPRSAPCCSSSRDTPARTAPARVSQATIAGSAGITDRGVRKILQRLEALGLIVGETRPGKVTIWTLNLDWTLNLTDRGQASQPRNPRSGVNGQDPGTPVPGSATLNPGLTPERPRNPRSDEGEGEGQRQNLSLSAVGAAARGEGEEDEEEHVNFDPLNLVALRRLR
jgi:hypothetical protein